MQWFGDTSSPTWHCYTIGHSNHTSENFLQLLKKYTIDTLVDVRSTPFSQYQPQFNRDQLKDDIDAYNKKISSESEGFTKATDLKLSQKITYVYMGDKLGGRYDDRTLFFKNGVVDYNKVRETPKFNQGIEGLFTLIIDGKTVAIMCTEKDPLDCHRFLLVSHSLAQQKKVEIDHILADGTTISNGNLERKLVQKYRSTTTEESYKSRNLDVGYSVNKEPQNPHKRTENQTLNV
ncbi:MAG: DUF488 domain-containing protein [Methanoregula sp.]|jgi:uncharacterized protein (DUF488 family)